MRTLEEERLYTTRLYLEKLSNGQNPRDDSDLPAESILNNVTLCRTFRYAADVLGEVLNNRGQITPLPSRRKKPFAITEAQKSEIRISRKPIGICAFHNNVSLVLDPTVKNVPYITMTEWLENGGLLETVVVNGEKMRVATLDGEQMGIRTATLSTRDGREYRKNLYDEAAQRFLIDHLTQIAEYGEEKREKREKPPGTGDPVPGGETVGG